MVDVESLFQALTETAEKLRKGGTINKYMALMEAIGDLKDSLKTANRGILPNCGNSSEKRLYSRILKHYEISTGMPSSSGRCISWTVITTTSRGCSAVAFTMRHRTERLSHSARTTAARSIAKRSGNSGVPRCRSEPDP